jgi:hypothetical protein
MYKMSTETVQKVPIEVIKVGAKESVEAKPKVSKDDTDSDTISVKSDSGSSVSTAPSSVSSVSSVSSKSSNSSASLPLSAASHASTDDDESDRASEASEETLSVSSDDTVQKLSHDPLFLVLSHFLMSEKGDNIVTVLEKINDNLTSINKHLQKASKKDHKKH